MANQQSQRTTIIDFIAMGEHFAGDEDILVSMIENFLVQTPLLITEIANAITVGNAKDLEVSAHTLKGNVSNFFAKTILKSLQELEQMGKNNNLSEASETFQRIHQDIDQLFHELNLYIRQQRAG